MKYIIILSLILGMGYLNHLDQQAIQHGATLDTLYKESH